MAETEPAAAPPIEAADGTTAPADAAPTTEQTTPEQEQKQAEAKKAEELRSARFAALARKERAQREADQRLKQEREIIEAARRDWEAKQKEWEAERAEWRQLKSLLAEGRKNPLKLVQEGVVDYGALTDSILRDGQPTPEQLAQGAEERAIAESKRLREEFEAWKREQQEKEQRSKVAEAERARAQIQADITSHLRGNADEYELIAAAGQEHEVFELMRIAYQERQQVLSVKQAADMVEKYLYDQAKKLQQTKKLAPPAPPAPPVAEDKQPVTKQATQAKLDPDARAKKASQLVSSLVTSPAQPKDETPPLLPPEEAIEQLVKKVKAKRAAK